MDFSASRSSLYHRAFVRRPAARNRRSVLAVLSAASLLHATVMAEGFRSPTIGTAGLGSTGGRIAFVDDASAVQHNPANLVELQSWEVSAEPTLVYHAVEYTSPTGGTAATEDRWKLLPHLFVGGPLNNDRLAFGFGVTVPFGLSVDWGPGGALRYRAARYVELKTFNFNPALSFRMSDTFRVGLGLDVMYSELTLRRYIPISLQAPGFPDGDLRIDGSGTGASANAGFTWEFLPGHRLAATIRAPMNVDYEGDLETRGVPTGDLITPFNSKIRFPTIITVGYGVELTDRIRLETNLEWLEFSRFHDLPIGLDPGLRAALGLPAAIPQNWEDTITIGLSGTWEFAEGWWARLSYQYFESPVPEETYSPEIPDANQHAIAAGIGYRLGPHRFEAAYSRVFYENREIRQNQNPDFLGRYEAGVHLISASYGFSF